MISIIKSYFTTIYQNKLSITEIDNHLLTINECYTIAILYDVFIEEYTLRFNNFLSKYVLGVVLQYLNEDLVVFHIKNSFTNYVIFYGKKTPTVLNVMSKLCHNVIFMEYQEDYYTNCLCLENVSKSNMYYSKNFNNNYFNEIIFNTFVMNENIYINYDILKRDLFNCYLNNRPVFLELLYELIWTKYEHYKFNVSVNKIIYNDLKNVKFYHDDSVESKKVINKYLNIFLSSKFNLL